MTEFSEYRCFKAFGPKENQNGPQVRFFLVLSKVSAWNFSDFLYEVMSTLRIKLDANDFERITWRFLANNGSKWV